MEGSRGMWHRVGGTVQLWRNLTNTAYPRHSLLYHCWPSRWNWRHSIWWSSPKLNLFWLLATNGIFSILYVCHVQVMALSSYCTNSGGLLISNCRNSSSMCSNETSNLPLGDQLVVNARGIAQSLPLTEADAQKQSWTGYLFVIVLLTFLMIVFPSGACFYSMGYHYFYDLASHPNMSWEVRDILAFN